MPAILISLTSFGADSVRRHGQLWFTQLAHAAGADGVEVRGELLADARAELPLLARAARELALDLVYSSPDGLWNPEGKLDRPALARACEAAQTLGAERVKMALGGYRPASAAQLAELAQATAQAGITLLVENDQTESAGTRMALLRFFAAADAAGLSFPMTFDIGNWHWTGECPQQMAQLFAPRVAYVHCKGVQRQPQRWVAVPLADSAAPWRAILHGLPADVPWAIEYPLAGEDLAAITRTQIDLLRATARHQL
jgi:sugar phosphate isomerase/epimerase